MSNASLELGGDNWAAKDGNLLGYAVGDSSGKYVPREFTFTRGSNLAATRVAANGLIEKGRENLLLHSNSFNNWTNSNTSETSGQSGYDGSSDAWLLEKSAASGFIFKSLSGSGVQTFSAYVKANASTWGLLQCIGGSNPYAYFDLGTGVVGSIGGGTISNSIEDVGGGWYRISLIHNTTISSARIYPAEANTASGTSGSIYIQDAQLEQGLVATDYIETGATTVQAGLLEDEPRIDYTGGTGSLLLEPSRTNEFSFSEYASGNTLTGSPIITENYAISPDGGNNAFRIQDTTGGTFKRITESFSVSANSTYTQSIFVKKATSAVSIYGGVGFDYSGGTRQISYIIFDEYNGTMTAIQSQSTLTLHDAEDYGDYWRFSITATDTGSNNYLSLNIYACLSTNGTSPTAGVKDWIGYGLQLEEGSYPTSYIPNHSGGSVTRELDTINEFTLPSSIEGDCTIFIDTRELLASNKSIQFEATDGTLTYGFYSYSNHYDVYNGSAFIVDSSADANGKIVLKQSGSSVKIFVNGVDKTKAGATVNSNGIAKIIVSQSSAQSNIVALKQMQLFPTALSDAQCSALTVEGLKEEILTSYIAAVDTLEDGAEARLDTYLQNLEDLIV